MRTLCRIAVFVLSLIVFTGCSALDEPALPLPTELQFPTALPTIAATSTTVSVSTFPTPTPSATETPSLASPTAVPATFTTSPSLTPSATITNTATPTATRDLSQPLDIDFDAVMSLPLELRTPVRTALETERQSLPDINAYTVSAYREREGWMKIQLVPTALVDAQWHEVEQYYDQSLTVFAERQPDRRWIAVWDGSATFADWHIRIPPEFANVSDELPVLAGEYRFPWPEGRT